MNLKTKLQNGGQNDLECTSRITLVLPYVATSTKGTLED